MTRLLWLADVLRAEGLTVHEQAGWRSRGYDEMTTIAGVICHATAGSRQSTPAGDVRVLMNGSQTAPPPISQLYLARSGDWHVIASGICYHAGRGGAWGVTGNGRVIGVEAANDNRGEPWPVAQYESYVRGVAAILRHLGLPAARALAHREWSTSGKTDPVGIDMAVFRARVAAAIAGEGDDVNLDDDITALMGFPTTVGKVLKSTYDYSKAGKTAALDAKAVATDAAQQAAVNASTLSDLKAAVAELAARPTGQMPTAAEVAAELIRQLAK